ncbi:flagellar basal body rod protein FlgC [Roseicella aquatilis]|uniref:Flagellar basal-body rod protein FlgC n=1 Tax=Roseicella aquatilis TaxID=2527868 RepID=A0A4R4D4Y2_9PROT|nr:flagellar basal body rod protein FlgC [Roseicella aquatilis]TCZ53675.1 flagellar basal body rod protein FlgC [Roseicella aquatilis]
MDLDRALAVSAAGMSAQSTRLRVVAENMANQDSLGQTPGADPYRRRTVSFSNRLDRELGVQVLGSPRMGTDSKAFPQHYDPSNPAADDKGYVKRPNVDSLIELMDMREAQGSYKANLAVLETTRGMLMRTIQALG